MSLEIQEQDIQASKDSFESQFLTFSVEDESYGVDIIKVMEIKSWEETTIIPESPEYMRGVIDLRGVVVPIFDLKKKFGSGEIEIDKTKVVIVLDVSDKTIGVLVDGVSDILNINSAEIKDSPQAGESQASDEYIDGLISQGDKMIILLNIEKLFDINVINQTTNNQ